MQIIKEISESIEEELEGAEQYIKSALKYEHFEKTLASMYQTLAQDEMRHVTILHNEGVKLINEYKQKGEKVPEAMQAVYDYLHEKHIEHANEIKMLMDQYGKG